ncbi:hypothetical protein K2Y11_03600 [bacterium]|nr:hypothetical protein [bacterium]
MKLIEAIAELGSFDDESTIYASEPWNRDSIAIVEFESDAGCLPTEAQKAGLKYFLEVFIARDFLDDWTRTCGREITLEEMCARLIQYAINDA